MLGLEIQYNQATNKFQNKVTGCVRLYLYNTCTCTSTCKCTMMLLICSSFID